MNVKSGDTVVIISGKEKGKTGKILTVLPKENRVIVEGINIVTKHKKPGSPTNPGGIVKYEAPINASKVMYYCEKDKKGVRVGYNLISNGDKVRICKNCGEVLDKK